MCGIAGALITSSSTAPPDLHGVVERMVRCIRHRGPDDAGVLAENGVGLGHARLSIIDLSAAGQEWWQVRDGSNCVSYRVSSVAPRCQHELPEPLVQLRG